MHSIRRRARDREERLSAELSFVKKQLKEAIDLLATKEEEVSTARAQKSEQDERAAATLARLKERDHHATWLERRLAEVLVQCQGTASAGGAGFVDFFLFPYTACEPTNITNITNINDLPCH